jgi:hypothetical protein
MNSSSIHFPGTDIIFVFFMAGYRNHILFMHSFLLLP